MNICKEGVGRGSLVFREIIADILGEMRDLMVELRICWVYVMVSNEKFVGRGLVRLCGIYWMIGGS